MNPKHDAPEGGANLADTIACDVCERMRTVSETDPVERHTILHGAVQEAVAAALAPTPPAPSELVDAAHFPLTASVWFRDSTNEWVLEIEGSINDTGFTSRHIEPATTKPEDVPGLPSLYAALLDDDATLSGQQGGAVPVSGECKRTEAGRLALAQAQRAAQDGGGKRG